MWTKVVAGSRQVYYRHLLGSICSEFKLPDENWTIRISKSDTAGVYFHNEWTGETMYDLPHALL